jgi:pimeloyl-ACP methyl ester carboxylesterase
MDKKLETPSHNAQRKKIILFAVIGILALASITVAILGLTKPEKRRPQEPSKPYPYYSEDVNFHNPDANVSLAGTLTLPSREGTYPAVILISGSGPQTRDGEFAGHKQFLVVADYLTRNGVAVLRYDDRGFGKSTGNFAAGTSLDFSYDAESAIEFLKTRKEIQKDKIGLIGHSDGAMIAPMVAARSKDVSFIVLLAGPGVQGVNLLLDRQELIERKLGIPETDIKTSRAHSEQMIKIIINSNDSETAKAELTKFSKDNYKDIPDYAIPPGISKDEFIAKHIETLSTPWFKYFFTYDPVSTLQKVTCPVLALNGDKDVQVPSKENLTGIKNALEAGRNENVTIREIAGLNHAFQKCDTGMPDEYGNIEQTFSPETMTEIQFWITRQYK